MPLSLTLVGIVSRIHALQASIKTDLESSLESLQAAVTSLSADDLVRSHLRSLPFHLRKFWTNHDTKGPVLLVRPDPTAFPAPEETQSEQVLAPLTRQDCPPLPSSTSVLSSVLELQDAHAEGDLTRPKPMLQSTLVKTRRRLEPENAIPKQGKVKKTNPLLVGNGDEIDDIFGRF